MDRPVNYLITIAGLVQGVGFRPFIYRLADEFGLKGWVNNTNENVQVCFNADPELLEEHEHWLTDLARELGIPFGTLLKWQRVGWVHGRKVPVAGGRWALWADGEELSRLRNLRSYRREWPNFHYPVELTTPKPRGTKA